MQGLALYLNEDALNELEVQVELLRIFGQMPIELFSVSENVIYTDQ